MNWFSSGRFWMFLWIIVLGIALIWGVFTYLFWLDSVRNLNVLSIVALLLSGGAGFQSTLAMRKSDPKDQT